MLASGREAVYAGYFAVFQFGNQCTWNTRTRVRFSLVQEGSQEAGRKAKSKERKLNGILSDEGVPSQAAGLQEPGPKGRNEVEPKTAKCKQTWHAL